MPVMEKSLMSREELKEGEREMGREEGINIRLGRDEKMEPPRRGAHQNFRAKILPPPSSSCTHRFPPMFETISSDCGHWPDSV